MALCVHSKFQEVLLTSCPENLHVKILALMLFCKTVVGLQHNSERILLEILVYNEYTFGTLQKTNCLERFRTVTKIEKVWAAACTSWFFRYFMAAILNCYFNWQYSGLFFMLPWPFELAVDCWACTWKQPRRETNWFHYEVKDLEKRLGRNVSHTRNLDHHLVIVNSYLFWFITFTLYMLDTNKFKVSRYAKY